MIVLDTNILSELMRPTPELSVVAWLDAQRTDDICTTAMSIFELRYGIEIMPEGKRRTALRAALELAIDRVVSGRILTLDHRGAEAAAIIARKCRAVGLSVEFRDMLIAGIVAANNASLVTRNARHFAAAGIPVVDPWQKPGTT